MESVVEPGFWAWFPEVTAAPGEVIVREGDHDSAMLILVEGSVRVEVDGRPIGTISEEGAVFGEMAALLSEARSATVVAETTCVMRVVDDVHALCNNDPSLAVTIAQVLARRLDQLKTLLQLGNATAA